MFVYVIYLLSYTYFLSFVSFSSYQHTRTPNSRASPSVLGSESLALYNRADEHKNLLQKFFGRKKIKITEKKMIYLICENFSSENLLGKKLIFI